MWCNDYLNMLQMTKETVLHKAVLNGNIDIVKAILSDKRFTEFNAKDRVSDILHCPCAILTLSLGICSLLRMIILRYI